MNKEIIEKSDAVFRQMITALPHNTNQVYLKLQLKDCELYIPSNNTDGMKLQSEKRAYDTLIKYAGY